MDPLHDHLKGLLRAEGHLLRFPVCTVRIPAFLKSVLKSDGVPKPRFPFLAQDGRRGVHDVSARRLFLLFGFGPSIIMGQWFGSHSSQSSARSSSSPPGCGRGGVGGPEGFVEKEEGLDPTFRKASLDHLQRLGLELEERITKEFAVVARFLKVRAVVVAGALGESSREEETARRQQQQRGTSQGERNRRKKAAYELNNIFARFYIAARNEQSGVPFLETYNKMLAELKEKHLDCPAVWWEVDSWEALLRLAATTPSTASKEEGGVKQTVAGKEEDELEDDAALAKDLQAGLVETEAGVTMEAGGEPPSNEHYSCCSYKYGDLELPVPLAVRQKLLGRAKAFCQEFVPGYGGNEQLPQAILRATACGYLLASGSLYWGFGPEVYSHAREVLGARLECYASPFNASLPVFCSPLPLDAVFGSLGSFYSRPDDQRVEQFLRISAAQAAAGEQQQVGVQLAESSETGKRAADSASASSLSSSSRPVTIVANPPYLESELLGCAERLNYLRLLLDDGPMMNSSSNLNSSSSSSSSASSSQIGEGGACLPPARRRHMVSCRCLDGVAGLRRRLWPVGVCTEPGRVRAPYRASPTEQQHVALEAASGLTILDEKKHGGDPVAV